MLLLKSVSTSTEWFRRLLDRGSELSGFTAPWGCLPKKKRGRMDDLEDIIGGHVWLGSLGGIWHISTKPFAWARRALVWSGEAYLSYSSYLIV